jgi:hypothetical protein
MAWRLPHEGTPHTGESFKGSGTVANDKRRNKRVRDKASNGQARRSNGKPSSSEKIDALDAFREDGTEARLTTDQAVPSTTTRTA